jgi:hypothetical protein
MSRRPRHDKAFRPVSTGRLHAMGICDHNNRAALLGQNGHAEQLLGSIRCECLDQVVVFGQAHLRRVLKAYAGYQNELRTHLYVGKKAPAFRASRSIARIVPMPVLGDSFIDTFGLGSDR